MNILGMIENYAHLLAMGKDYPDAREKSHKLFQEIQKQIKELVDAGNNVATIASHSKAGGYPFLEQEDGEASLTHWWAAVAKID